VIKLEWLVDYRRQRLWGVSTHLREQRELTAPLRARQRAVADSVGGSVEEESSWEPLEVALVRLLLLRLRALVAAARAVV
jgi:hypothetical protein